MQNRYVIVMIDHYTSLTWSESFEDKVSDNLVKWAYQILMIFGKPETILTDNGGEVTNDLIDSKCVI